MTQQATNEYNFAFVLCRTCFEALPIAELTAEQKFQYRPGESFSAIKRCSMAHEHLYRTKNIRVSAFARRLSAGGNRRSTSF
jgi:hypothetical protein